jgi:nucleotide-binding universal stress UspA family protein
MNRKILVPIDLSEHSLLVLERAKGSMRNGDELVLIHVVYDPSELAGFHIPHLSTELAREELLADAGKQMDAFIGKHAPGTRYRLEMGTPFKRILKVADEESASLIVIGSHKGGTMAHFIVSHASEKVIRNAMVDVLVVPLPIESEEELVRRRQKMWK